jgi:ubiquinone/menaquinone biosynthesis C-methylase UbiE
MALFGKPLPRAIELAAASVAGAANVLEVAAGTGLFSEAIAQRVGRLVATDYSAAMVDLLRGRFAASQYGNVTAAQADIYALSFEPESFDAVVAANVLHLVPDLAGALAALRQVLLPRGKLVVPTFCHDETRLSRLVSRALAVTGFPSQRRFTSASLRQALESSGLKVTRQEVVPGLLPIAYVDGVFESR